MTNLSGGKRQEIITENLTVNADKDEYYYEMAEFIDLILSGNRQSVVNSHNNSLNTMLLLDEICRQLSVTFPADKVSNQQNMV